MFVRERLLEDGQPAASVNTQANFVPSEVQTEGDCMVQNKHTMARQFRLDSKRLQEYLENEDRLQENGVGSAKKKRKLHEGGKPLSVGVDKAVLDFMYAPWDGLSLTRTSAGKTSNVRRNWAYLSHSKLPQCGSDAGSTETR